ncbi:SDR family NAD(P)-dependent oxidoreductase [Rhizobium aouanii]|uniref:SDR family NAD(P)-dependent oxidoreductase n=1 Tax=Rhizobium aouanii TaxID=3118145 RepID=A0ABU8CY67_9HYPH
MDLGLSNKRVLVTGGNFGLGAAIAKAFAAEGARVAINYLVNPRQADIFVEEVTATGGETRQLRADISDPEAVEAMFRAIDDAWGGIDISW